MTPEYPDASFPRDFASGIARSGMVLGELKPTKPSKLPNLRLHCASRGGSTIRRSSLVCRLFSWRLWGRISHWQ